ncbi:paraflagellar rod component Par4 [Trypanosoma rangeli]|uniref:Paraflagellar rod component Par4 n=1 Tax=Trypanosoma rangeli TaxID=5698 RepID=A0A3R7MZM3_TRYRA|nr:paraflagellar rod component Par4 [Trypanosoma rangeli]RNF10503.1 paraflagellar rod component Par4 [Trypanosoma rangeli]|eukprot:RNF10503.1 paraflagellar rod component Par4 [Trypanosoma rangeli]
MPPKKGKKKGGKKKESAEVLRLKQLYVVENETEELQKRENDRRDREEQEERLILWKEEQARIVREKDARVKELMAKVEQLTTSLHDERAASESQVEQLVLMRDSLLNEVSLLRVELDEKQRLLLHEKQSAELKLCSVREEANKNITALSDEIEELRTDFGLFKAEHAEYAAKMEETLDNKEAEVRAQVSKIGNLQRELEKALAMNRSMQEVVEAREADDRKNVTLMQLLNGQLDENKRRYEEQIEEERRRVSRANEELLQLETRCAKLQDEVDALKNENAEVKLKSDVMLREYQQHLEQVQSDSTYLSAELRALQERAEQEAESTQTARMNLEGELQNTLVELEANQKCMEELELLLRRKERETFDKITFLNAQVSNNRTIISQLQQKLLHEQKLHETELSRTFDETKEKEKELDDVRNTFSEKQDAAKEREAQLMSEVAVLKATTFHLQTALQDAQRNLEVVTAAKDEEINRLCNLLDAHFIPHRKTIEGEVTTYEGTIAILSEKVGELTREMEIQEQLALENETHLRARITNQEEVIETLQEDLRRSEARRREEVRSVEEEVSRLKKTLEIHFIPYEM